MLLLDYNSLLFAIAFAGLCLGATTFITWLTARSDMFLLTWAIGALLIVVNSFVYSQYVQSPHPWLAAVAFSFLLSGLVVVLAAAIQFRTGAIRWPLITMVEAATLAVMLPPFLLGTDGAGFIVTNIAATILLLGTAREYWIGRAIAPVPITVLTVLYAIAALSFLPCAAVILAAGDFVMGHSPDNWAENLNLAVCIAAITGIGAMSLALNQWRLAALHERDALTDAHTGLDNRRSLFEAFGGGPMMKDTAVIVFDLDDFKGINDRYGHATGDEVLLRFASALRAGIREGDVAARIGGEEFAVVLPRATPGLASLVAERVRAAFSYETVTTEKGDVTCTVSAGVAFAADNRQSFDRILSQADGALYTAKRGGRNRVASAGLRLVG